MAEMNTVMYHSNLQQIRRVLKALGPDRIEKGLTAFEDGSSSWSHCFFARAFSGEKHRYQIKSYTSPTQFLHEVNEPERWIMTALDISSPIPIRIVYQTFDDCNRGLITKEALQKFISDVLDESRPPEILELIRTTAYSTLEPIKVCA